MNTDDLIRRKVLVDMLDNMSDDDKQHLLSFLLKCPNNDNTKQQLQRIEQRVGEQGFFTDLLANVSGNAIYNAIIWLGKTIINNVGKL